MVSNTIDCDSPVIVDGGAYDGRTTLKFQELFTNPTIHAVEPVPSHVEMFRENVEFGENVKLHTEAIGPEEDTVSMNIVRKSNSSSIFNPSELQFEYRNEVSEEKTKKYQTEEKIRVKQTRLDNLVDEVDIIKLDLQGYELPALHGATDILDSCKAIITEVEFVPYYENQPLFSEVDAFLSEHDFQLFNFSHLRVEPDGQLATTDAVYLHKDVYRYNSDLIYDPKRHK
jgi:FkbM family methyltransferase